MEAKIRELLTQKNMTQKELSLLSGIAPAQLSRLLSGGTNPTSETLMRISTALGVSVSALLEEHATKVPEKDEAAIAWERLLEKLKASGLSPETILIIVESWIRTIKELK
jgi:transcriptional regulator with XRE-family HTH domain